MSVWRDSQALIRLIELNLSRRPLMELRDVYKLLYQGVLGSEHLVINQDHFTEFLNQEINALSIMEEETLWESIRPDGALGRLNLKPYKARDGDLDQLVEVCLETSRHNWGTPEELRWVWEKFVQLGGENIPFDEAEIAAFTRQLVENEFPPIHHSQAYRETYQPAYRLVAVDYLPAFGLET